MCEYVYIRSSVSGFNAKQILLLNYDLEVYGLANIKSAKKRVITSQVRAERNKAVKSRVKTYIKKVEAAVAAGDKAAANEALPVAIAEIEKAASKGIFHKNAAARKVSHITKAVNDFKIVDLRIMYSPNSSSHTGIQYQSLYYTILYRVHLFSCMKGICNL